MITWVDNVHGYKAVGFINNKTVCLIYWGYVGDGKIKFKITHNEQWVLSGYDEFCMVVKKFKTKSAAFKYAELLYLQHML